MAPTSTDQRDIIRNASIFLFSGSFLIGADELRRIVIQMAPTSPDQYEIQKQHVSERPKFRKGSFLEEKKFKKKSC